MGSGGIRKRKHSRHLPKVGSTPEVEYAEREKRREVLREVGISRRGSPVAAWTVSIVAVALIAAVILFLTLR